MTVTRNGWERFQKKDTHVLMDSEFFGFTASDTITLEIKEVEPEPEEIE
jgi:hypothetical protein